MFSIAICGALFTVRPPTYASTVSGQHGSDCIHTSSIPPCRRPAQPGLAADRPGDEKKASSVYTAKLRRQPQTPGPDAIFRPHLSNPSLSTIFSNHFNIFVAEKLLRDRSAVRLLGRSKGTLSPSFSVLRCLLRPHILLSTVRYSIRKDVGVQYC